MTLNLPEIREKIDRMTDRILVGLKERSKHALNAGIFTEEFHNGLSWFQYRALKEQSLDAEFGRYEFEGQHPIFFDRQDLEKPLKRRDHPELGLVKVNTDIGNRVLIIYREAVGKLCRPGEDPNTYGEVVKLDVENVLALNERILGLGQQVAEVKLRQEHVLIYLQEETVKRRLRDYKRENEVVENAVSLAERIYCITNREAVRNFMQQVIDLTVYAEEDYVRAVKIQENSQPRIPPGFGQVGAAKAEHPFSQSSKGFGSA